jgi:hypothetical protein
MKTLDSALTLIRSYLMTSKCFYSLCSFGIPHSYGFIHRSAVSVSLPANQLILIVLNALNSVSMTSIKMHRPTSLLLNCANRSTPLNNCCVPTATEYVGVNDINAVDDIFVSFEYMHAFSSLVLDTSTSRFQLRTVVSQLPENALLPCTFKQETYPVCP